MINKCKQLSCKITFLEKEIENIINPNKENNSSNSFNDSEEAQKEIKKKIFKKKICKNRSKKENFIRCTSEETNPCENFLTFPFQTFGPESDSSNVSPCTDPDNALSKNSDVNRIQPPTQLNRFTKTSTVLRYSPADTVQFIKMTQPVSHNNQLSPKTSIAKTTEFYPKTFIWPSNHNSKLKCSKYDMMLSLPDCFFKANTIWKTPDSVASMSPDASEIYFQRIANDNKNLEGDKKIFDHCIIDSLRNEIEKVRLKLFDIGKPPDSIDENQNISSNAKEIVPIDKNDSAKTIYEQLQEVQIKNEQLEKEISEHKKNQANSMSNILEANSVLNEYEKKVNSLQEEALKSSKTMAASKEKFINILKTRNSQMKNLVHINNELKSAVDINDKQFKSLKSSYKLLKSRLKECTEEKNEAKTENENLHNNIKKIEEELKCAYKESKKLKEENLKFQKELGDVKLDMNEKFAAKLSKQKEVFEKKMSKIKENEKKLKDEILELSQKLDEKEEALKKIQTDSKNENMTLHLKYKKLSNQFDALVRKFKEYEYFDEIKCNCIEQELKGFSMKMQEKEGIIIRERNELRTLVEELAHVIKQNKQSLNELNRLNSDQDAVIQELNSIINQKNVQLENYETEIKKIREESKKLQNEMKSLKHSSESNIEADLTKDLQQEIHLLKNQIKYEKDSALLKEKVIENQEETIQNLKQQIAEKSGEIQVALNDWKLTKVEAEKTNEELNKIKLELMDERREKNEALDQLKEIHKHKEYLVSQVNKLEETVKSHCLNENSTGLENKITVDVLEHELKKQRKEWEIQKKILQSDKEKAIHAAKFASQKLLDTVNDFQKQIAAQKIAQIKLTHMLREKENQLEKLNLKVKGHVFSGGEDNHSKNAGSKHQLANQRQIISKSRDRKSVV